MPIEIVNEYPCKLCDCLELEEVKTGTFYWVEQDVFLIEYRFYYKCASCKNILIRIIKHKKETYYYKLVDKREKI